jgi:hypothetical protein
MPVRIQLKRTKKWRKPPGAIVVCRPSRFGNPFRIGMFVSDHGVLKTKADCVNVYREWVLLMLSGSYGKRPEQAVLMGKILRDLEGRDLACSCKPGEPCHADVLLELANRRKLVRESPSRHAREAREQLSQLVSQPMPMPLVYIYGP